MSRDAEDWVWNHSRAKGTARLVMLAVAKYASGSHCKAYAGTAMLRGLTLAGRTAVKDGVDAAIALGELKIVEGETGPKGETVYELPKAADHIAQGGPESDPGQNPARVGNKPRGGTESDPGGVGNKPRGGTESGPLREKRGSSRKKREDAGARDGSAKAPALSEIPPNWTPDAAAQQLAAADLRRLGPIAAQHATRKFIAHHRSRGLRLADIGQAWAVWLARERPDPRDVPTPTAQPYAEWQDEAARLRDERPADPPPLHPIQGDGDGTGDRQPSLLIAPVPDLPDLGEEELAELRAAAEADYGLVLATLDELGEQHAIALYGGRLVAGALATRAGRPPAEDRAGTGA